MRNGANYTNPYRLVDRAVFTNLAASEAHPERSIILKTDEALDLTR
jgi:hypothetical protein